MPEITAPELNAQIATMTARVIAWRFPDSLLMDAGREAFGRYERLRILSVNNTLEGLRMASALVRDGHLREADEIVSRAGSRWQRWLRQARTITQREVSENDGMVRELSLAFDGAIDQIVTSLPDLPTLPTIPNFGLGVGLAIALVLWTLRGRR
jgi:hypothetical protein